jgi:hypothetical protein
MPILGYFNNMWYGSASGAMDGVAPSIEITASPKIDKRLGSSIEGGGVAPTLKLTRALKQTLVVEAGGEMITALPKKQLTAACSVSIGAQPSAFDIAQAIWQASSSQYNASGSMGEKLNNASSAGNPWSASPETNNGTGTMGKVINDIKKKANLIPGLY